jgi:hypothetical protein
MPSVTARASGAQGDPVTLSYNYEFSICIKARQRARQGRDGMGAGVGVHGEPCPWGPVPRGCVAAKVWGFSALRECVCVCVCVCVWAQVCAHTPSSLLHNS